MTKIKRQAIFDLSAMIEGKTIKIKKLTEEANVLKEEVRGLMKEADINRAMNNTYDIKVSYPQVFDVGLFIMNYPEKAKSFVTVQTKKYNDYNKADIKKNCPEAYAICCDEQTPRLTIKRNIKPVEGMEFS